jgi:hypothetical protein
MRKDVIIRKITNASLALLLSASCGVNAMEVGGVLEGKENPFVSRTSQQHDSVKRSSLANQIRARVQEILKGFQENMNAYYKRTGNPKKIEFALDEDVNFKTHSEGGKNIFASSTDQKLIETPDPIITATTTNNAQPDGGAFGDKGMKADKTAGSDGNFGSNTAKSEQKEERKVEEKQPGHSGGDREPKDGLDPGAFKRGGGTEETKQESKGNKDDEETGGNKEAKGDKVGDVEPTEPQKVLTADELKAMPGLTNAFDWNNLAIQKAANYCCLLFKTTEVSQSRVESTISKINMIYLLQQAEPMHVINIEDISRINFCFKKLQNNPLLKEHYVNIAIAKYAISKHGGDIGSKFGILKLTNFKEEGWWNKEVTWKASFATPPRGQSQSRLPEADKMQQLTQDDHVEMNQYLANLKATKGKTYIEQGYSHVIIIFDDIYEYMKKDYAKGPNIYPFKSQ